MTPDQLAGLLSHVDARFGLERDCEVTLEAHPGTVDPVALRGFRQVGATRLSVGGESLDDTELRHLGREHGWRRVVAVVEEARSAGFQAVNVDLMYGIPGQTLDSWDSTVRRLIDAGPDHLSLYPLSIEPRTVFARKRRKNLLPVPEDDAVVAMYHLACERLRIAGYEHYEVANWSRPGKRCLHNLAYWYNREFYAAGVGAHGYLRPYRTENLTQTGRYIETVLGGASPVKDRILLDRPSEFNETVTLRLRLLRDGLELGEVQERFGIDLRKRFAADLSDLLGAGLIRLNGNRLTLAEEAVPVANEIWQRFMVSVM